MLTIKNYYTDSPIGTTRFSFIAGCTMYDAKEKTQVYHFRIRDANCKAFCEIYLTRHTDPSGHYTMWGHNTQGHGLQKTTDYKINAENVKNILIVVQIMNVIIDTILKEYI